MNSELILALEMLEKEKGISQEYMLEAIKEALLAAYKKNFSQNHEVRIDIDDNTGKVEVFTLKTIVAEVEDPETQLDLAEIQKTYPDAEEGDVLEFPVTPKNFGRIAAQTGKQVIVQKIREAEKNSIFDEYQNKENDIISGTIQRNEVKVINKGTPDEFVKKDVFVDIGRIEAIMPEQEMVRGEEYTFQKKMKFYVTEVRNLRGLRIKLSRTHPNLVKCLFELEVPEIKDGIVEIKSIAREPGSRTKIAVYSRDEDVDAVGSCVGHRGARVQAVVDELNGEKIDIIQWNEDVATYISESLSPSEVLKIDIDEETKSAKVVVPDNQLSLAIGKDGQNARLAARLTGWKIDIKSYSAFMELSQEDDYEEMYEDFYSDEAEDADEAAEVAEDSMEEVEE